MTEKTKIYPMKIGLEIYITDGKQIGTVSYSCPMGRFPDEVRMKTIFEEVLNSLPKGFRLMNYAESATRFIKSELGIPGDFLPPNLSDDEEWFDPETANDPCFLFSDETDEEEE